MNPDRAIAFISSGGGLQTATELTITKGRGYVWCVDKAIR